MVAIVIVSRIHVDCYCGMVVNDSDGGNRPGTWHGVSWAEWKEGGNDTESLWLDPLFK